MPSPEEVRDYFDAKARELVGRLAHAEVELLDDGDEYHWKATGEGIDVDLTLLEEFACEGEGDGFAWDLEIQVEHKEAEWECVVDMVPFNYTNWLWLHDLEELATRLHRIAAALEGFTYRAESVIKVPEVMSRQDSGHRRATA